MLRPPQYVMLTLSCIYQDTTTTCLIPDSPLNCLNNTVEVGVKQVSFVKHCITSKKFQNDQTSLFKTD